MSLYCHPGSAFGWRVMLGLCAFLNGSLAFAQHRPSLFVQRFTDLGGSRVLYETGMLYGNGRFDATTGTIRTVIIDERAAPGLIPNSIIMSVATLAAVSGKYVISAATWNNASPADRAPFNPPGREFIVNVFFALYELTLNTSLSAPAITAQPSSRTVNAGADVTLSLAVTGSEPLIYQWRRNGVAIPGATTPTLSVPGITLNDDNAVYNMIVSNAVDLAVSNTATVTVLAPPRSQTTIVGGATTLSESAPFPQGLAFQWRHNGRDVAGATGPSLTLANVGLEAAGGYTLVVGDGPSRSTVSVPAIVTVGNATASGWLANLSVRGVAGSDAETGAGGGLQARRRVCARGQRPRCGPDDDASARFLHGASDGRHGWLRRSPRRSL